MPLHRLTTVTVGVPNVEQTAAYYTDFGLTPMGGGAFRTEDGGEQFRLVHAARRSLVEIGIGVDDRDDLDRVAVALNHLVLHVELAGDTLIANEPIAGFRAVLTVSPRLDQPMVKATPYNGPGRVERANTRAPGIVREGQVKPRKLGHVVIGSTDGPATQKFFTEGLGFKV